MVNKLVKSIIGWLRLLLSARSGIDSLYLPLDHASGLYLNIATITMARLLKLRVILHHHVSSYLSHRDWRIAAIERLLPRDSVHVFVCDRFRRDYARLYGERAGLLHVSNAAFVPMAGAAAMPGSPLPNRTPAAGKARPLGIGHLSNLSAEKGLATLLAAFEALRAAGIEARLVLAGPCAAEADRARIADARRSHGDAVDYRGAVYGTDKERFYADIDVFAFPTHYPLEAEPLVVIEALDHGCPVVAIDRGCIGNLVGPRGGAVVKIGDDFTAAFVSLCRELAGNADALFRARTAAVERARQLRTLAAGQRDRLFALLAQEETA